MIRAVPLCPWAHIDRMAMRHIIDRMDRLD